MLVCGSLVFGLEAVAADDSAFALPDEAMGDDVHHFVHRAMGTEFTFMVELRDGDVGRDDLEPIVGEAFEAIDTLERQISSWIASSDTSEVNRFGSEVPVKVRREAFDLFEFSAGMYRDTGGIFDVTVGPLLDLRRGALEAGREVSGAELRGVLGRVGMDKVVLNAGKRTVYFKEEGMRVSFGGIGKGLALDRAAAVLKEYGVENALLNGGRSSMVAMGAPAGKDFWKIGIRNPYNDNDSLEVVELNDQALSTSACYYDLARVGSKPCEIYDPRTGEVASGLWSVTVVAQSGMETDALSTAFYVMGVDGARAYCAGHPEVNAILVPAPVEAGGAAESVRIGN